MPMTFMEVAEFRLVRQCRFFHGARGYLTLAYLNQALAHYNIFSLKVLCGVCCENLACGPLCVAIYPYMSLIEFPERLLLSVSLANIFSLLLIQG